MVRRDPSDKNARAGVSSASSVQGDWTQEQRAVQNPLIRALLGSIRLLGEADLGTHRVLGCNDQELMKLWRTVEQVVLLLRNEVAPLLAEASLLPSLERARLEGLEELGYLDERVLRAVDHYPATLRASSLPESRKVLQLAIEKLHLFLLHLFGEVMAADPRSSGDADYFLLRRLPRELGSSRALLAAMGDLETALARIVIRARGHVETMVDRLRYERMVPGRGAWAPCHNSLGELTQELLPALQKVVALPGLRTDEAAVMARHCSELPGQVSAILEVYDTTRTACAEIKSRAGTNRGQREQSVEDLITCHGVFSRRLASLLEALNGRLAELSSVIPLWRNNIERRRAVLLARKLPTL